MDTKHYTIPVFIPELACPFQCIFCNQRKISGHLKVPSPEEVKDIIGKYLETIPTRKRVVEIGFFGGNFTGIPQAEQEAYLKVAIPYLEQGKIQGIRLSTRPDYISVTVLKLLKKYKVNTIELGAQSMHDEVLQRSSRGHTVQDTITASGLIRKFNFRLGLQMMIGLPGDSLELAMDTATQIVELRADNTRIYPTLVIKETKLEELYHNKKYKPLPLDDAVFWSKEVFKIFEKGRVKVIRMGLHPSEGLITGKELVAGPFHKSFRELAMTELWWEELKQLTNNKYKSIRITVHPKQLNFAVGYSAKNKKRLLEHYNTVVYQTDVELEGRDFYADNY